MDITDEQDPVPLGHRFDVVWRGYQRRQVNEYVDNVLRTLTSDRDAATSMVCELVKLLDETRAEMWRLRERYDRVCDVPFTPAAVDERLRRRIEMAHAEASAIVVRARVRAEHIRVTAAEGVARAEAAAAHRRRKVDEDFHQAMALRRTELMRDLREHEAACRAEAEHLLLAADQAAAERVAGAEAQVAALHTAQRRLANRLRVVRGLFLRTCALVDPLSGAGPLPVDLVERGADHGNDG